MELVFDERGLLLPGDFDVSMEIVKECFGAFQKSDRRPKLFARLVDYADAVKRAGCGHALVIDGSFVMKCIDEPDDIDIVLILPADWDETTDLQPFKYNVVSKKSVRRQFGFDVFTAMSGTPRENELVDFFGQVDTKWVNHFGWPDTIRKGIVRVIL